MGTMKCVEFGRQQREQLFDRQGMQIPRKVKLAEHICKAARASGTFSAQSRAIPPNGSVVVKPSGNSHDGVAGDQRWSGGNQRDKYAELSWCAAQQRHGATRIVAMSPIDLKWPCQKMTAGPARVFQIGQPTKSLAGIPAILNLRTQGLKPVQGQPAPKSGVGAKCGRIFSQQPSQVFGNLEA